jgi:hypothetical protein
MSLPQQIRAGDSLEWIEAPALTVSSSLWTLTAYLRSGAAGITVEGVARADGGWDMILTATQTAAMAAGTWSYQAVAANGAARTTLDSRTTEVLASLAYSGSPAAFDGRSQAEQDLAAVQAAIRTIVSGGVSQYTIGNRQATKLDLGKLMERESQLKGVVARERAAARLAAGRADGRDLFVRFG